MPQVTVENLFRAFRAAERDEEIGTNYGASLVARVKISQILLDSQVLLDVPNEAMRLIDTCYRKDLAKKVPIG